MKRSHFNKLCKKLEEWEIIEQSLGMIRLTRKFNKLIIKNFKEGESDKSIVLEGELDKSIVLEGELDKSVILSVLEVMGSVEQNELSDYCCVINYMLPSTLEL
tara:strand:- start:779 stop:1087 length:309 start_codon:yes stop_codon:yes gene_type:complete